MHRTRALIFENFPLFCFGCCQAVLQLGRQLGLGGDVVAAAAGGGNGSDSELEDVPVFADNGHVVDDSEHVLVFAPGHRVGGGAGGEEEVLAKGVQGGEGAAERDGGGDDSGEDEGVAKWVRARRREAAGGPGGAGGAAGGGEGEGVGRGTGKKRRRRREALEVVADRPAVRVLVQARWFVCGARGREGEGGMERERERCFVCVCVCVCGVERERERERERETRRLGVVQHRRAYIRQLLFRVFFF
jgi:hypothetical protein